MVPCAERRRAAPRALLSEGSAPTGRLLVWWPPPRLAAGAKAHQRRIGRSGIPSGRPLAAGHLPAATSGALGAPRRFRGSAPPLSMPGAWPPRPARLSARPPSDASSRTASWPQPGPNSLELLPPLKCAINFPSLPRPARPPPPRPRLLQLPPSPPASPSPRPRVAPGRPPPCKAVPAGSPRPTPCPCADPRGLCGARLGAQGMNISVLAKLPSADVMAPAAVATRRIPLRGKEEARGKAAPGACWSPAPQGHPLSRRGARKRRGTCPLRASGGTGKHSWEAGASEPAHVLGESAPSVGFKRPLSAPRVVSAERG